MQTLLGVGSDYGIFIEPDAIADDTWRLGVFDGDTGKNALGVVSPSFTAGGHWDWIKTSPDPGKEQLVYELFADPLGTVDPLTAEPVCTFHGNDPTSSYTCSGAIYTAAFMPDNEWFDVIVPVHAAADPESDGSYRYRLHARFETPQVDVESSFRLRASGRIATVPGRPFQLIAPVRNLIDYSVVYPEWPALSSTTYDGAWSIFIDLPAGEDHLDIWDGDFDHGFCSAGSPNCPVGDNYSDTDDPNTAAGQRPPGGPFGPEAEPPGYAEGTLDEGAKGAGDPADDAGADRVLRSPSVKYSVTAPNGAVFTNDNPSGNREWELFRICLAASACTDADVEAIALPAGLYEITVTGHDLSNINALILDQAAYPTSKTGDAALGNTVYFDIDEDGFQDANEPGIGGVTVHVTRDVNLNGQVDPGEPSWFDVTGPDGTYLVDGLAEGQYVVRVDDGPLTPLSQFAAVTPNPGHQVDYANDVWSKAQPYVARLLDFDLVEDEVGGLHIDDNLTVDFGYVWFGGSSGLEIGDTVFLDLNGNGTQDGSETGIDGVLLEVFMDWNAGADDPFADDGTLDGDDVLLGTATTAGGGKYLFSDLPVSGATYFVRVAGSNFDDGGALEGLLPTVDGPAVHADPGNTAGPHDSRTSPYGLPGVLANTYTADFGYLSTLGSIGDYVWYDADADGIQDGDEPGIGGITVELWSDDNANGVVDGTEAVVATDTTDGSGGYLFEGLGAGAYVVVIPSTQTTGAGPLASHTSSLPLSAAATTATDSNGITVAGGSVIGAVAIGAGEHNHTIDFGFFLGGSICLEGVDDPEHVGATIHYVINTLTGTATVRTTLARSFADNAYGRPNSTSTGWPGTGRKFEQILTSDNLNLLLKNGAGQTVYNFTMDLLAYNASAAAGHKYVTNGVVKTYSNSDGSISVGSAANVLGVKTSISENLNNTGWTNYVNSPAVDANYVGLETPAGWIWDTWYEATVQLAPFGDSGFGKAFVPALHSSPSKTGVNAPAMQLCPDDNPPVCEECATGALQMTLKISYGSSGRDVNERIRVRENDLYGAVIFDSWEDGSPGPGIATGASFSFLVANPGVKIVVTVQGNKHPDEYVKATFKTNCDLVVPTTSGNNYIKFKVTDATFDATPSCELPPTNPGTGTPGYWKTHSSAWPTEAIIIGGLSYTKAQAIAGMKLSTTTDKTKNMFEQLVSAKLNVMIGNDASCIAADIAAADAWMADHPLSSGVSADSSAWQSISATFTRLDDYNNGRLCAPHRG